MLQLLAATEKTGELEVRGDGEERRGFLGLSRGRLVSARYEDEDGPLALGAVFAIDRGGFEFLPQDRIERADLDGDIESLLERAKTERERVVAAREVIANDRVRFRLSERATESGDLTLAPAQWRALLLVDGERDVAAIAERLGMTRLSAQQLLAGVVRAGFADPLEPAAAAPAGAPPEEAPRAYRRLPPMPPIPPTQAGEQVVLRGGLADFPLETIVQLLAETKKTGRLEVRAGRDSSTLGMSDGRLVSAVFGEEEGEVALGAAFTAHDGDFEFVPMTEAPKANLSGGLDPLLDRAAAMRDTIAAIRAVIPSETARFTLSERATRNPQIVLSSDQWRVLLGVNGERDVAGIAEHLRMRRLPAMMVLTDLIRGGYVDVVLERSWPQIERRRVAPAPAVEEAAIVAEPIVVEEAPAVVEEPTIAEELLITEEPVIAEELLITEEPVIAEEPVVVEEPAIAELVVEEPVIAEEPLIAEEAAIVEEPTIAEAPPPEEPVVAEAEAPLADTPLDHDLTTDDRLAALSGIFGPAEPAPPPPAWEPPPPEAELAAATAEALAAAAPPEPEIPEPEFTEPAVDPRLAAFGVPPAEPEAPSWEPRAPEPAPSQWATSSWEAPAPAEPEVTEVDPRLAAFNAPPAEPAAPAGPAWEAPAWEAPPPEVPAWEAPAPEAPPAPIEAEPAAAAPETEPVAPAIEWPERAGVPEVVAPAPAPVPEKKKGLFGGLFGGGAKPAPVAAAPIPRAASRPGLLANFANELVAAYNSGQYGKGRVEERMLNLVMRADEQADPIDRPLPITNDRLDIGSIDRSALPERQALPYLAILVRQIYDEAEHALGKDKARRGFRDVRDRLFGRDLTLLHAPEVSGRMPKI